MAGFVIVCCTLVAACGRGGGGSGDTQSIDEQVGLDQEGMLQRQAQAENGIRDCMKAQGFEYVPVDPAAQQAALVGAPGMGKDDFEKQYGYGITTLYEQRRRQVGAGANDAIRAALSPADRVAYDRALHGDDPTATLAQALDSGDFTHLGGCIRKATEAVFGGAETLTTLQSKLDELDERIQADPRMVKAISKWSGCMRAAGFAGLEHPQDVDATLQRKLEAIVGTPDGNASTSAEPDYDTAALAALQHEEVSMVAADKACESRYVAGVEEKVAAEYERTFREENAGLLAKVPAR
jgi:hypothetical protein